MPDVLQQIEVLLRHANENENIDEARNAGLALARLIRKHHITLVLPAQSNGTSFPPPRPTPTKPRTSPKPKPKPTPKPKDDWQRMRAKFKGFCKWCRKPITPNMEIFWHREHGAYHPVCFLKTT